MTHQKHTNTKRAGAIVISGIMMALLNSQTATADQCEGTGKHYFYNSDNVTADWQNYLGLTLHGNPNIEAVSLQYEANECAPFMNAVHPPKFAVTLKYCKFIRPKPVGSGTSIDYGGDENSNPPNLAEIETHGCTTKVIKGDPQNALITPTPSVTTHVDHNVVIKRQ